MGSQYEAPPYGSSADHLLGWFLEAQQDGAAWLANQPGAKGWEQAMLTMTGPGSPGPANMSNLQYPKVKRQAKEMVDSLSSFRHEGEFKVLWDNSLYDTAHLLTQLDRHWYKSRMVNLAQRSALQYAVNLGTAYLYETWDPVAWGPDKGDIKLDAISPADVTFVQMPKDNDIQKAYVVLIRQEMPINLAKRLWMRTNPAFAASLTPDREQPSNSWVQRGLAKVQQFVSPALRAAGRTGQNDQMQSPTVDIYTAYTMDGSINLSPDAIRMGVYGTNWSYLVPSLGSPKGTGHINPQTGEEFTVPNKESDCLMFPLRRMTIFSATGIGYDGSSPWWHGEVPLARLWFNDVPWTGLGGSITADVQSLETGIVETLRLMEDSVAARLDPPAIVDDIMATSWGDQINPRKAGVRARAPLSQIPAPIIYPFPPENYNVPPWIPAFVSEQEGRMDYITGVRDLVAMAKAKQIPGSDTLEKLMEMAGPIVQGMVRAMEEPLTQLGTWRKAYYFQFYNEARIINTVGPEDGAEQLAYTQFLSPRLMELLFTKKQLTLNGEPVERFEPKSSFQFTPGLMLPPGMPIGQQKEKLKRLITEFTYEVTESGINEINRMTTKLFYLQLMKEGFPISSWTFARIARIPNFGPPPEGTNTEYERWVAEQRIKIELQASLQEEMNALNPMAAAGGGPPAPPGGGNGGAGGRPQSYEESPRIVSKDGGARSTITTASR